MQDQDVKENKERVHAKNPKAASGSFLSKLYQDDDEYEELRIQGIVNEDDAEVLEARDKTASEGMVKRKTKTLEKM